MKPNSLSVRIFAVWVALAMLSPSGQAQQCTLNGGDPLKPLPGTLMFVSHEGTASLCGFAEFTAPSTPAKRYKTLTTSGQMTLSRYLDNACAGTAVMNGTLGGRSKGGTAPLCGFSEYTSPSSPVKKYRRKTLSGSRYFILYWDGCVTFRWDETATISGSIQYSAVNCSITDTSRGGLDNNACVGTTVERTRRFNTTNGVCAACWWAPYPQKTISTNLTEQLDDEDTEDDAIARFNANSSWSTPGIPSDHTSYRTRNPASFDISLRQAQTQATIATGLTAGANYEARVTLYRRAAGTTDAFVDSGQTLTESFTASGASHIGNWLDLPNENGWEYLAESVTVVATIQNRIVDNWNITGDYSSSLPGACTATTTNTSTRTDNGNSATGPFGSTPSSAYGSLASTSTQSASRTTTGLNQCVADTANPGKYLKASGTITETLSNEDTPANALDRAKAAAAANTGSSNTAYETTLSPSLQIGLRTVHYLADFDVTCPGNYDVHVTYSVTPHGAVGPATTETVVTRRLLESGRRTVEGDVVVLKKDMDYTVVGIELHAPGCEAEPPGYPEITVHSVKVALSLGRGLSGIDAGHLRLEAAAVTAALYTPAALTASTAEGNGVETVRESGAIRQLKAPQTFADIVTLNTSSYEVRFYALSGVGAQDPVTKIYALTGTPYVVYKFENPDSSSTTRLRITETRGSITRVSEYAYGPGSNTWTLSRGNGLRQESLAIATAGSDTTKTSTIMDAGNVVVGKVAKTYRTFAWGDELISEVVDPDGAALTTTYLFYSDPVNDGGAYGRLKQRTNPNGSWERHTYDAKGRPLKTVRPYLDAAVTVAESACRVTENVYTTLADADGDGLPEQLTTTIETTLGTETGRTYQVEWSKAVTLGTGSFTRRSDIRCVAAGAAWNDSANLVTETLLYTADPYVGRTRRVIHPDGTATLTAYTIDANGEQTAITKTGQPNGTFDDIIAGTRTVGFTSAQGQGIGESTADIASSLTLSSWTATQFDAVGRPTRLDHADGTYEIRNYACCGLSSAQDRAGAVTTYQYDDLGRQTDVTRAGLTTHTTYDADDRVKTVTRIGADNSPMPQVTNTYDLAGRLTGRKDALNRLTSFAETIDGSGHKVRTTTNPDGGTVVQTYARDGSLLDVYGTAAPQQLAYEYGLEAGSRFTRKILVGAAGATTEWVKSYADFAGRAFKTVYADNATAQSYFNAAGQLVRQVDPDGVTMLFAYNARGEQDTTAVDLNGNGIIDYAGPDRITRTVSTVTTNGGTTVQRATTMVWETDNQDTPVTATISDRSTDGLRSWQTVRGLTTTSVAVPDGSGGRTVTTTGPDGVKNIQVFASDRLASTTIKTAADVQLAAVINGYDPHGRLQTSTDARNGTTSYTYFADDAIQTVTTPDPDPARSGPGYDPQTTAYHYDAAGRPDTVTQPDATVVNTTYWPTGAVKRTWGSRTYPTEYTYDPQGRVKTLTTWQDFANSAGAAVTTWNYNPQRGWLDHKLLADNTGPSYTYKASGRLQTRVWARGTTTTYAYTAAGDLSGATYSDSTPAIAIAYDRAGRPKTISDASGVRTLTYDASGQLQNEDYTSGLLNALGIHRTFDSLSRLSGLAMLAPGSSLPATSYSYDAASRLSVVTQGANSATYGYLANSPIVSSVTFQQGGTTRLTTNKTYDNLNRLSGITNTPSVASVQSVVYSYNAANQRTKATREDSSYWNYGYDALGQVTSGKKFDSTNTALLGHDFAWSYDDIGNRKTATTNSQLSTYTSTLLNAYTQRTVPGAIDVLGEAQPAATVTVNYPAASATILATTRQGNLFYKQLAVNNTASAQNPALTVTGVKNLVGPIGEDALTNITRTAFIAQTPEVFTHDADGNLTSDARWSYTWDGENRLIAMETSAAATTAGVVPQKLEFGYDGQGRRFSKKVYSWSGGVWVLARHTLFLYDGWNLIAEFDSLSTLTLTRSYVWGLDLSGSMQGAGGVGGLLFAGNATSTHFAAFDGNGNVSALVDAGTGAKSATYEYNVFGETLIADGPAKDLCPLRFSTKYTDAETGLLYYGQRYCSPGTGRWLNRDIAHESGGYNLYGYVNNDATNRVDYLGLWARIVCGDDARRGAIAQAEQMALESISGLESRLSEWNITNIGIKYPYLLQLTDPAGAYQPQKFQTEFLQDLANRVGRIRAKISENSVIADACSDPEKQCNTSGHVVAYTHKGDTTIWICSNFFTLDAREQAGFILHEYSHLAAYTDDDLPGANNALAWPNYAKWAYFYNRLPTEGFNSTMDWMLNDMIGITAKAYRYVK